MRGRPMPIAEQQAELQRLEALQRERALTDAESATLENLLYRASQRARRVADRLRAARAKVARLEAMAA